MSVSKDKQKMYLKRNIFDMNLSNFMEQFPDEESCKLKFKAMRNEAGVTCRHCGAKIINGRKQFGCMSVKDAKSELQFAPAP